MRFHSALLKLLVIIACFVNIKDSYCQSDQILNFEKLTINDGLSQGFIYNINQDDKGFMWFCTPDGLNRYDGYHFKIYRHDDADSFSISSNFVTRFLIDTHKNIWVGTQDNGLNHFDIVHQKFYHFFPGLTIGDVIEDKYGNLLINYRTKIIIVKIKKIEGAQLKKITLDTTVFTLLSPVVNADAAVTHRFFTDADKNIYFSSRDGIFKLVYDKNLNGFSVVKLYSFLKNEDQPPKVTEDKTTHKFYTYLDKHLVEFSKDFSNTVAVTPLPDASSIFIDSKHTIWYGSSQMLLVNANTKSLVHVIPKTPDIKNFLSAAYSAFEDKSGNIWLGTSGLGILKFSANLDVFHHSLPDTYIYHLQAYDKETVLVEGNLKIKISNNGSVNIDTIVLPSEIKKTFVQSSVCVVDSTDNLCFFADNKLQFFNTKNKRLRIINIKDKLQKQNVALANVDVPNNVKSNFLFPDSHNNMWFQCFGKMMSYNIKKDSLTVYPSLPAFEDIDKSFRIIYEDHEGVLWITTSQDFYRYNPADKTTKFFHHTANDTNTVASSNISCFCDDPLQPAQYLWIGTRGSGLSKLNKATGKCTSFNAKNGLPNNVIYGLLTDNEGDVWGSTNKGLFRLNVKTGSVKNFDVTDGLQGNEFNRYAYLKLDNGVMIFGGLNGINYFKPGDIKPIPPPNISLTNITLLNKNLSVNKPNSIVNEDVSYLKDLSIKSNQNIISFEFAAMDYRKTRAAHYRYRLNGFDNSWNNSGLNNTATYTNLNPGNYTFSVQASNDDITWSGDNTLLNLHVLPMWWQTWLFKIFVVCCIAAIVYSIYRYRLQQLLKVERVRNNIARDLHDEIGSSLSSISIFSKLAQKHINTKEANPDFLLEKINEDASYVMDSMSDIVWSINTKNDEFENVFYRMREHAVQLLEAKNYNVHFDFDERLNHVKFNMQSRRDFYLIYKEALNNIAKYADGKNVWINLSLHNNKIELSIKDDGKGFDISTIKKGNGLGNMQKRADAINAMLNITSGINEGSILHLSFFRK